MNYANPAFAYFEGCGQGQNMYWAEPRYTMRRARVYAGTRYPFATQRHNRAAFLQGFKWGWNKAKSAA